MRQSSTLTFGERKFCLAESLLAFVLRRLSDFPQATFRESELRQQSADDFDAAVSRRLLRFVQTDLASEIYPCSSPHCEGSGRSIALVGEAYWAVCSCLAREPQVNLTKTDLQHWRVDIDRLCSAIRSENALTGESEGVDERLVYVGKTTRGGQTFGILLGLFGVRQARLHLRGLPRQLLDSHDRLVVLCAGFTPPGRMLREFEPQRVLLAEMDNLRPLMIDGAIFRGRSRAGQTDGLTEAERAEMARLGLLTSVTVYVTGRSVSDHVVRVNGLDARLTRTPFCLFLRLMIALYEAQDGFVPVGRMMHGGGLADEGFYRSEGVSQAWNRMRTAFRTALLGIPTTNFLEVRNGQGRISTLRSRVSWDTNALLGSGDTRICELAERLITASATRLGAEQRDPGAESPVP
jgi:hypothetical protein